MQYKVGQVLYTCSKKSVKIIPMQVVEIITRVTIDGDSKEYVLQLPDKEKTVTPLSNIKSDIFTDIESIKEHLISNATAAIEEMISLTQEIVSETFKTEKIVENKNPNEIGVQAETNDDIIMVDLGNGVKAKMNTSNLDKVANQWKFCF